MAALIAYVVAFVGVGAASLGAASAAARLGRRVAAVGLLTGCLGLGTAAWVGVQPGSVWVLATSGLLLLGGASLGAIVGARIEAPGHLLPVAVVSSLVDLASVLHPFGPSANVVASPGALALLAVWFPMIDDGRLAPVLGVGDVVFCALYVAAIRRHGLSSARVILALALGLLATMGLVLVTGIALPALPALGAAVVIALPEARRLPPADRRNAWIVMALLAIVVAALLAHRWYALP